MMKLWFFFGGELSNYNLRPRGIMLFGLRGTRGRSSCKAFTLLNSTAYSSNIRYSISQSRGQRRVRLGSCVPALQASGILSRMPWPFNPQPNTQRPQVLQAETSEPPKPVKPLKPAKALKPHTLKACTLGRA